MRLEKETLFELRLELNLMPGTLKASLFKNLQINVTSNYVIFMVVVIKSQILHITSKTVLSMRKLLT